MPEESAPNTPSAEGTPAPPKSDFLGGLLKTVKLDWIRPLLYKLGGRKLLAGGGGLYVIKTIVEGDMSDTGKIVACVCSAVVAVGTAVAIALEDRKGK